VILASTARHTAVTFDAQVHGQADDDITAYEWSFGDGASMPGKTVTYSYQKAGTYMVTLTVTDKQKRTRTAMQTVFVK
jgi:PKD repeat protein